MRQHQVRSDLMFHFVESSSAGISPVPRGVVLQQAVERAQCHVLWTKSKICSSRDHSIKSNSFLFFSDKDVN